MRDLKQARSRSSRTERRTHRRTRPGDPAKRTTSSGVTVEPTVAGSGTSRGSPEASGPGASSGSALDSAAKTTSSSGGMSAEGHAPETVGTLFSAAGSKDGTASRGPAGSTASKSKDSLLHVSKESFPAGAGSKDSLGTRGTTQSSGDGSKDSFLKGSKDTLGSEGGQFQVTSSSGGRFTRSKEQQQYGQSPGPASSSGGGGEAQSSIIGDSEPISGSIMSTVPRSSLQSSYPGASNRRLLTEGSVEPARLPVHSGQSVPSPQSGRPGRGSGTSPRRRAPMLGRQYSDNHLRAS